jgi:hypothetical protein
MPFSWGEKKNPNNYFDDNYFFAIDDKPNTLNP